MKQNSISIIYTFNIFGESEFVDWIGLVLF